MKTEDMLIGVVNCLRLHIYEIDAGESTEDFYKIYTAIGAEGFCQKEFITIKQ